MASKSAKATNWVLDYSDIIDIFKNSLKIENLLKSIQSIYLNSRYKNSIDYKPYFQRNYVWDIEKSTYFIESILLGTEIPPLVLFKGSMKNDSAQNEVIDGRQRYETLLKFLDNDIQLKGSGLHRLSAFADKKYIDFDDDTRDLFLNTKLRILQCSVSNEPALTPEKEDKIKKEIFKRYNSGITPLSKEENARAEYINDSITTYLRDNLFVDDIFLTEAEEIFLPRSRQLSNPRDRMNFLLDRVRSLLAMTSVPIFSYAKSARRSDIINQFYTTYIALNEPDSICNKFFDITRQIMIMNDDAAGKPAFENFLFFESLYWGLSIIADQGISIEHIDMKIVVHEITNSASSTIFWENIFNPTKTPEAIFDLTGSHYRNATIDRHRFIANYLCDKFDVSFDDYFRNDQKFTMTMRQNLAAHQLEQLKYIKPDPVSITIDDIIRDMGQARFEVRPPYQRSEVTNIKKASYLIESLMLGIKIPPIYLYKRSDKVKEVIDGQQRILTILGFLGESYVDENGCTKISDKHKFKLSGLKILKELNSLNIDIIREKYPRYIENILDFSLDIVEIDAAYNPNFSAIDLFLRLNTKPFPIQPNTFEMWNAFVAQHITQRIKNLASQYEGLIFRTNDTRMSNEELITSLTYLCYQKNHHKEKYHEMLTIYVRRNHICARISSKDRITKMLENLTNDDMIHFELSIDSVSQFIIKIKTILDATEKKFSDLADSIHKTDQNFYYLWILFESVSIDDLKTRPQEIFDSVNRILKSTLDAPEPFDAAIFVERTLLIC